MGEARKLEWRLARDLLGSARSARVGSQAKPDEGLDPQLRPSTRLGVACRDCGYPAPAGPSNDSDGDELRNSFASHPSFNETTKNATPKNRESRRAVIHAPEGTRTPNLLIRSQMLYPIELRAQR